VRRAEAQRADELSAEERARVLALYDESKALLESARTHAEGTAAYRAATDAAPRESERIRQRLAEMTREVLTSAGLGVSEKTPAGEIEQRLTGEKGALASLESALQALEEQVRTQAGRPAEARAELAEVRRALDDLRDALSAPTLPDQPPAVSRAIRSLAEARVQAKAAALARLEQELVSHEVRLALLEARRDLAARELALARSRVQLLHALATDARRREAAEAVEQAGATVRETGPRHPVLRAAAEENATLTRRLAALVSSLDQLDREVSATENRARRLERDFQRARQRADLAGVSTAVARTLMQERRGLAAAVADRSRALKRSAREPSVSRHEEAAAIALEQLDVDERRRALADLQGAVDDPMEQVEPTMPQADREALRADLVKLLEERQGLLAKLDTELTAYLRALGELDFVQAGLESLERAFGDFLDGRLLWIPSTYPVTEGSLAKLRQAIASQLAVEHWQGVRVALASDLQRYPARWAIVAVALLGLGLATPWVRRHLTAIAARVRDPATDRFSLTLVALVLTGVLALPAPLALGVLGWRLEASLEATDFSQRLGAGFAAGGQGVFAGLLVLALCRPWGVAGAHFRWPEAVLGRLRSQARLFLALGVPAAFVVASVGRFADETHAASLGRSAFIILMAVIAYVLGRVLSPRGPIIRPRLRATPPRRLAQLWVLWLPAVVGAPLALAGLAASGYYYTAGELALPSTRTLRLAFIAIVLYSLGLRWLEVGRREMTVKLARENLEAEAARRAGPEGARGPSPVASASADLAAIEAQARQLFNMVLLLGAPLALWVIWAHVLPAFDLFQGLTLWHYTSVVDGQSASVPITLGSVLLAIVIGVVAGAMAGSLPGVLEVVLLRHLSLARGSRYAIKTLLKYAIAAVGALAVFGTLGLSWSKVQWLVAALSVGLGFGLQEIVANFVSGIIILFERPIRVGDWVTVGNLTGTVSNISIRATTIVDFDRKEILVPNKSLITTDVVNWSLTDPITRIKVLVGIAYGSDVRRARQVMLDTLRSLPLVRSDPEPRVWFVGFGASSLDFEVHAFASELSDRMPLTHAVHVALEEALREHGIEIAFPQQDLHLRTVSPEAGAALAAVRGPPSGVNGVCGDSVS
jgi:potassium efflux system protein